MSDSDEGPSWSASDAEGNEARDSDDGEDNGPRDNLGLAQVHDEDEGQEIAYEVLTPVEIISKQQQALVHVQQVLPGLPTSSSRILLQHFKWDSTKMLAEYTANPNRLRQTLGLPREEDVDCNRFEDKGSCAICFEEEDLVGVECGHKFCIACWREYLHGEVQQKHKVILCPGNECSKVLDDLTVIAYLDDEETKNRFRATLVHSFVDDNPMVRWCPAPHCTNAIVLLEVHETHNEAVTCTCGVTFCFRCGVEHDHRPNSCRMFGEWRKKQGGGDTSLNDQLIATISRHCPKCNTSIQKNGGCNHMKCTHCSYHFCWQCMQKFGSGPKGGPDGYNTHRCNRPYEDDSQVSLKKEELQRFYWHSDRYNNHARSLALEQKLLAGSPEVVAALCREMGLAQQSCTYYTNALKQLVSNRTLLMQSYVFGYFRPMYAKAVNRDIFENLQLDLELHTEKLSHVLEDLTPQHIHASRQTILQQAQVARNVYHGLMDSANEWTSQGDVNSPPLSPSSQRGGGPSASAPRINEGGERLNARKKGSVFFKKLFKRESGTTPPTTPATPPLVTNTPVAVSRATATPTGSPSLATRPSATPTKAPPVATTSSPSLAPRSKGKAPSASTTPPPSTSSSSSLRNSPLRISPTGRRRDSIQNSNLDVDDSSD